MIEETTGLKHLPVADLIYLLELAPMGARAQVNQVGNLMLSDEDGEYLGYIDFLTGELKL